MTLIPRHLLPQIPADKLDEFRAYLSEHGCSSDEVLRSTDALKPIQSEYRQDKVDSMCKDRRLVTERPIIVTIDGFIVDGHHRWLAAQKLKLPTMKCLVCNCPLSEFLTLAHDFDHTYTKSVHESAIYGHCYAPLPRLTDLLS